MLKFLTNDMRIILFSVFFLTVTACTQAPESEGPATPRDISENVSLQIGNENEKQDTKGLLPEVKTDETKYDTADAVPKNNVLERLLSPSPKVEKLEIGKAASLKKEWGDHPICGAVKTALVNFPKDQKFVDHGGIRIDLLADIIKSEVNTPQNTLSIVNWKDVPATERDSLYFNMRYAKTGKLDVDIDPNRYHFFDEPRIWSDLERGYITAHEYITHQSHQIIRPHTGSYQRDLKSGKIRLQRHDLSDDYVLFNAITHSGMQGFDPSARKPYVSMSKIYVNSSSHIQPILALKTETSLGLSFVKLADLALNQGTSDPHIAFLVFTHGGKVQILSRTRELSLNVVEYDPETFSDLEGYVSKHEQPVKKRHIRYAGEPKIICEIFIDKKKEWEPSKLNPIQYTPPKSKEERLIGMAEPCMSPHHCGDKVKNILRNCNTGDSCDHAVHLLNKARHSGSANSFTNLIRLSDIQSPEVEGDKTKNRFVQRLDRTVPPQYIHLKRRGRSPNSEMCNRLETRLSSNLSELIKIGQWEVPSYDSPRTFKRDFDLRWVTWLDSPRLKNILEEGFPYDPVVWTDVPQEKAAQFEYDLLYPNRRLNDIYRHRGNDLPIEAPTYTRPELGAKTQKDYEYFRYIDIPVGEGVGVKKESALSEARPTYRLFKYKYKSDSSDPISPHMPYPELPEYNHLKATYVAMYGRDQIFPSFLPKHPVLEFKKYDRIFFVGASGFMREPDTLSSLSIKYFDPRKGPEQKTQIQHRRISIGPVLESAYCRIDLKFSPE